MKKLLLIVFVFCMGLNPFAFAGETRTTPQYIVLHNPTTNQVELVSQKYLYGSSPSLELKFQILDSQGDVYSEHLITLTGQGFTDFVDGFGATMKSRGDAAIWQYVQANYTTQANP